MKNLAKNTENTKTEKIETFLHSLRTEVEIMDYINIEDIDCSDAFNSISDMIQDNNGFDIEIIYYSNAIKYLQENDPSLRESLKIANEYGFSLDKISSETLASLLASQNAREEFNKLQDEINTFFAELDEEENED
jgi:intracellular sulfur oxidation DsrE/DsrF family protein